MKKYINKVVIDFEKNTITINNKKEEGLKETEFLDKLLAFCDNTAHKVMLNIIEEMRLGSDEDIEFYSDLLRKRNIDFIAKEREIAKKHFELQSIFICKEEL